MRSIHIGVRAPRSALLAVVAGAVLAGWGCNDEVALPDPGAEAGGGPTSSSASSGAQASTSSASVSAGGTGGAGGAGGGAGGAPDPCTPGFAEDFEPTWVPPAPLQQGACTAEQAEDIAACSYASRDDCADVAAAAPECAACAISAADSEAYGPIIEYELPGALFVNQAGCVAALTGDVSASGCGATMQAFTQCQIAACAGCDGSGHPQCMQAAADTSCAAHQAAALTCFQQTTAGGGPVLACTKGATEPPLAYLERMVQLFCGPGSNVNPCPACAERLEP